MRNCYRLMEYLTQINEKTKLFKKTHKHKTLLNLRHVQDIRQLKVFIECHLYNHISSTFGLSLEFFYEEVVSSFIIAASVEKS